MRIYATRKDEKRIALMATIIATQGCTPLVAVERAEVIERYIRDRAEAENTQHIKRMTALRKKEND